MEFISKIKELLDSARLYAELKLKELKLEAAEKISTIIADLTAGVTLFLFVIMFIFFASLWAAVFLNQLLSSAHLGFLIVGCLWLFAGVIIFTARKWLIKNRVSNYIVKKMMDDTSRRK